MLFAPNWFVQQFKSSVWSLHQSTGFKLKSAVSPEGSIQGLTVTWPYFGVMEMQEKSRGSETPPANPDQGMLSATLKDYDLLWEIHKQDVTKMTANEQQAAHEGAAKATGRKSDAIIFNAVNGATGLTTIGTGAENWDLFYAMQASESLLDDDLVDANDLFSFIPYRWFNILMTYKEFNNSEWVGSQIGFPTGVRGKSWNGVNWVPLSKKEMITPSGTTAYGFMWSKRAVGYASNYEGDVTPAWDNRKGCWTFRSDMQACAMALDPTARGVRRLFFKTDTALQRPVERTQAV